jgi:hypothetical protein
LPGGWSNVRQFGAGVTVTRALTPNLSVSGYYSFAHAITSGAAATYPNYNSQNLGVSFQGKFLQGESWSLGGSIALSSQMWAGSFIWTPTGSLNLTKSFRAGGSIIAAYSRSEASTFLASGGYYDQGDISYNRGIGSKFFVNADVGVFQTAYTGYHETGKRAGGSVNYRWLPRLTLNASYFYLRQSGVQPNFFLGNTSLFSFGLNWLVGAQSGL